MFNLWARETASYFGYYRTERAALRVVYDTIQRLGCTLRAVRDLELTQDGHGSVAHGVKLVERAEAVIGNTPRRRRGLDTV
jgi:hypothetical protein